MKLPTDPLTDLITHIAQKLHAFREDNKQQPPTNLRSIATWNVGGWTPPGRAGDLKHPIALQETQWSQEQATKLVTLIPGAQVVAAPATIKNTHPSGGVAVILPVGYEVLSTSKQCSKGKYSQHRYAYAEQRSASLPRTCTPILYKTV